MMISKKINEDVFQHMSPSPFGGTKDAEYRRTIEYFDEIYKQKGLYFALAMLYDSGYDRDDILHMMEILKPGKGRVTDILPKTESKKLRIKKSELTEMIQSVVKNIMLIEDEIKQILYKKYVFEIYTKNPETGEEGWDIKFAMVVAKSMKEAILILKRYDLFDEIITRNIVKEFYGLGELSSEEYSALDYPQLSDKESYFYESKKIKNKKSELTEDVRNDIYKKQIEKEFPEALSNYDGKISYSDYYLELVNNKIEQEKLQAKELAKQKRLKDKEEYNKQYGERDKQWKKENKHQANINFLEEFVDFLPKNLKLQMEKMSEKNGDGLDGAFYYLMGKYGTDYSDLFGNPDKVYNDLTKLINNDKYEDIFFNLIDKKYGEHVIEW